MRRGNIGSNFGNVSTIERLEVANDGDISTKPIVQSAPTEAFSKPYIDQKLTYTPDGQLIDEQSNAVMMTWEDVIMKHQAEDLCWNGGDILNIGFGLGLIDTYIQDNLPKSHWIIELHPDVHTKMVEDGWLQKPNVTCIFKSWQDVYKYLPKFDAIYIDTWQDDWLPLLENLHNMLKPSGIFSFFNNVGPLFQNPKTKDWKIRPDIEKILSEKFDIEYKSFELPWIASPQEQRSDGKVYWHPDNTLYHAPICSLKSEYRKER